MQPPVTVNNWINNQPTIEQNVRQVAPPPPPPAIVVQERNYVALIIGAVGGFFGLFGLGYFITGRGGRGVVSLLVGFAWIALFIGTLPDILGSGASCLTLVHLAFVFGDAVEGSRVRRVIVEPGSYF